MAGAALEWMVMLGYALLLGLIAVLLEWVAKHAHRCSVAVATAGFTYHPEKDIWSCPKDQHLFPVFSDHAQGVVIYRAPASACNSCPSRAACTDSSQGREIQRNNLRDVEHGMKRFRRGVSLTLLTLASVILSVELFRARGAYPRIVLAVTLALLCILIHKLSVGISQKTRNSQLSQ